MNRQINIFLTMKGLKTYEKSLLWFEYKITKNTFSNFALGGLKRWE